MKPPNNKAPSSHHSVTTSFPTTSSLFTSNSISASLSLPATKPNNLASSSTSPFSNPLSLDLLTGTKACKSRHSLALKLHFRLAIAQCLFSLLLLEPWVVKPEDLDSVKQSAVKAKLANRSNSPPSHPFQQPHRSLALQLHFHCPAPWLVSLQGEQRAILVSQANKTQTPVGKSINIELEEVGKHTFSATAFQISSSITFSRLTPSLLQTHPHTQRP